MTNFPDSEKGGFKAFVKAKIKRFCWRSPFLLALSVSIVFFSLLLSAIFFVLNLTTLHGDYVLVPDIRKLSISEVHIKLSELGLRYEISDSAAYNPALPKRIVVDQNPAAGSKVKDGRKIYLTINPSRHRRVKMPDIIQLTMRNAEPLLRFAGLKLGKVRYVKNIGKDVVLEAYYNNHKVQPGAMIPETSEIDLDCGDGY